MATREQLLAGGVTRRQIDTRLANGEYRSLYPGVYLVVPFLLRHSLEMAAVLACGPHAALSHYSAAYLYGLLPHPAQPGPVHVTVASTHTRRLKNVRVHRAHLNQWEIREQHDIPVTAPVRTLLDLAPCCTDDELEAAVAEAFALRRTNRSALLKMIPARRRGATRLRALLHAGPRRTRSSPERLLLTALRATGLDEPLTNHRVGRWEADFYWPAHRLVVEIDGYGAHSSPTAFERDRRKDADLSELGLRVQRFSADTPVEEIVAWIERRLSRT